MGMYYIYIETRPNLRVICSIKKKQKTTKKNRTIQGDKTNHHNRFFFLIVFLLKNQGKMTSGDCVRVIF